MFQKGRYNIIEKRNERLEEKKVKFESLNVVKESPTSTKSNERSFDSMRFLKISP